jgi:tight adherence protein C
MFLFALEAIQRPVILIMVFALVVTAILLLANSLGRVATIRRRLDDVGASGRTSVVHGGSLREQGGTSVWTDILATIESRGIPLLDNKDQDLRARLIAAGFTAPEAPRLFTLIRLVATIALPTIVVGALFVTQESPSVFKLYFIGGIFAALGLYLPNLIVQIRADRRRQELVNGFPNALDLMLVCVEAGLGLEAALDRVGREVAASHKLIAEMFGKVVLELRAGRSRADALRRMADSTGVTEIRSFATLIIQSDKLGSSIGQTLRIYAAEMREKRRMRAEEKAHRLPVLLSIPLVCCMLPVMIGVLMLPAGIRVVRDIVPALQHHHR